MPTDSPPIHTILDATRFWSQDDDYPGLYLAYTYDSSGNDIEYAYETDELTTHHPRMADIIEALVIERAEAGQPAHADGLDVSFSIDLQEQQPLKVVTMLGDTAVFSEVLGLSSHYERDDRVYVGAYNLTTKSVDTESGLLTIVTHRELGHFCVMKTELDTKFPGWESRWTVGKDLGMENRELMHQVFRTAPVTVSPQEATVVSGLSFE